MKNLAIDSNILIPLQQSSVKSFYGILYNDLTEDCNKGMKLLVSMA